MNGVELNAWIAAGRARHRGRASDRAALRALPTVMRTVAMGRLRHTCRPPAEPCQPITEKGEQP
jgi:hypothetical protein